MHGQAKARKGNLLKVSETLKINIEIYISVKSPLKDKSCFFKCPSFSWLGNEIPSLGEK